MQRHEGDAAVGGRIPERESSASRWSHWREGRPGAPLLVRLERAEEAVDGVHPPRLERLHGRARVAVEVHPRDEGARRLGEPPLREARAVLADERDEGADPLGGAARQVGTRSARDSVSKSGSPAAPNDWTCSSEASPMPRAGTLTMRARETSSSGAEQTLR